MTNVCVYICVRVSQMATFLSATLGLSVGLIWGNNNMRWEQGKVARVGEGISVGELVYVVLYES